MLTLVDETRADLIRHAAGWQFGEQGILTHLAGEGCVVEIGGGDGTQDLPLTCEAFVGQRRVIVYELEEGNRDLLRLRFGGQIELRGRYTSGEELRGEYIAVAVVDVDGLDAMVMEDLLKHATPGVLMVEHYDTDAPIATDYQLDRPPPAWLCGQKTAVGHFTIQAAFPCLDRIADEYGYRPVCRTRVNSIYTRARQC